MGSTKFQFEPSLDFIRAEIVLPRIVNIVGCDRAMPKGDWYYSNGIAGYCNPVSLVPIIEGPFFERDQYDDKFAEYLVVSDPLTRRHLGSLRLLRADRPHILGSVFPDLCDGPVPRDPSIREITQVCLSPSLRAGGRRLVSRQLATALVEYALLTGITAYTTVTELVWSRYVSTMGWMCESLGLARAIGNALLGAFQIHIGASTIGGLRATGCYTACELNFIAPGKWLADGSADGEVGSTKLYPLPVRDMWG